MKNVVSSAAEAEFGALFHNTKESEVIRVILGDLGHSQPSTPLQADNKCTVGISNDSVKQKRSKAVDMRYYWVCDCVFQGHFNVYWKPGTENYGDYFTKYFAHARHRKI